MGRWPGSLAEDPALEQNCSSWGGGLSWPSLGSCCRPSSSREGCRGHGHGVGQSPGQEGMGGAHGKASVQVMLSSQRLQTPELTASSRHESAGWVMGTDTTARRLNNLTLGWKSKATVWAGWVSLEASGQSSHGLFSGWDSLTSLP